MCGSEHVKQSSIHLDAFRPRKNAIALKRQGYLNDWTFPTKKTNQGALKAIKKVHEYNSRDS